MGEQAAPLRLNSKQDFLYSGSAESEERAITLARISTAARLAKPANDVYTRDDSEAAVRSLELAAKKGYLYDLPTTMLGIRQVARYAPDGTDNANQLVETIISTSLATEKGTKAVRICESESGCINKPIVEDEFRSVISPLVSITSDMNPRRSYIVTPGTAAVMAFVGVTKRPELVSSTSSPQEILANAEKANPNEFRDTREAVKACIRQDFNEVPSLDLNKCAKEAARFAIYTLAKVGIPYQEPDPAILVAIPDVPTKDRQAYLNEHNARSATQR